MLAARLAVRLVHAVVTEWRRLEIEAECPNIALGCEAVIDGDQITETHHHIRPVPVGFTSGRAEEDTIRREVEGGS